MPSHYETLGVRADADVRTLRKAYLALAQRLHPDRMVDASPAERSHAAERMREVNEAWRVLGDPARRRAYDLTRGGVRPALRSDGPEEDRFDGPAHVIRSLPWVLLVGVLLLIFVISAYAGGGSGGSASECVRVLPGPATTQVRCDADGARRVVSYVDVTSPCPDGTERLELPEEPRAACLNVP